MHSIHPKFSQVKTQTYNIHNSKFFKYFTFYIKMLYKIQYKQLIISMCAMSEQEKFLNRMSVYSNIFLMQIQIEPFHTSELWVGIIHYLMFLCQHSMMFSENLRGSHWSMKIVFIPWINTMYNWICSWLFATHFINVKIYSEGRGKTCNLLNLLAVNYLFLRDRTMSNTVGNASKFLCRLILY
jgi:hypothetical protein